MLKEIKREFKKYKDYGFSDVYFKNKTEPTKKAIEWMDSIGMGYECKIIPKKILHIRIRWQT